jgi:hypothetical protein
MAIVGTEQRAGPAGSAFCASTSDYLGIQQMRMKCRRAVQERKCVNMTPSRTSLLHCVDTVRTTLEGQHGEDRDSED